MTLHHKLDEAYDILDRAAAEHKPVAVVALFSGGNDSLATVRIVELWAKSRGRRFYVAHINTGIGVQAVRLHVRQTACDRGWGFREYFTPPEHYIRMVTGQERHRSIPGGFPGGALHTMYYRELKDRRVDELMREMKRGHKRRDRVMLVSGIRRQESKRRMGYANEVNKHRAQVWVNPAINWSADDVLDLRDLHRLPESPVAKLLHRSGECNCGAMADESGNELDELRWFFPDDAAYIDRIAEQVAAAGYPAIWGVDPPAYYLELTRGQLSMGSDFTPLCVGCIARHEVTA